MALNKMILTALLATPLAGCAPSSTEQEAPRPLDTSMQKPPVADPSQPVASGNTPTAADIAAAAALNAQFDPARDPAADLETAKVEAKRGGKRIVLNIGSAACEPCKVLDDFIGGDAELRSFRDANYVWVKVNHDDTNPNEAFLSQFTQISTYPHLLVLDNEGKLLHSQVIDELAQGKGYDRKKFFAFLKEWAPAKT